MSATETETTDRYIFEFCEIRKPTCNAVDYDEIETLTLPCRPAEGKPLHDGLRNWTLSRLRAGLYDLGLYSGLCTHVDEEGDILGTLGSVLICWDGRNVLFARPDD